MTTDEEQASAEKERLTALGGIAALSLDALSSVAYGPEAILLVLVAAGTAGLKYTIDITGAIVVLLAVLIVSYRQVIAAFPNGGGAYAVSKRHLGTVPSLVAAASLIVDYVLNAAVGVSAGVEALTAAFPGLYGARVWLCLGVLAALTAVNLWGIAESARLFMAPTLAFIVAIFAVIAVGLLRGHPAVALAHQLPRATDTVGTLLILKAFASGCSALTGVEAIANSVPQFRQPRARRAQRTEVGLGALLGAMLRAGCADPALGRGAAGRDHGARAAHRGRRRAQCAVLHHSDGHAGPARPGRQHLLRRAAGARRAARARQLPAARVRPARRPEGVPLRRRLPGRGGGAVAARHPRRHPGADTGVRGGGLHRLHAVPGWHGEALVPPAVRGLRPVLDLPGLHQRRRRGADVRGDGH